MFCILSLGEEVMKFMPENIMIGRLYGCGRKCWKTHSRNTSFNKTCSLPDKA